MFCLSWSSRATLNTSRDSCPHFHTHVVSFQKSPLQICRVSRRILFALSSNFTSMLKSQMWRHTWWQTLVLCNSQCSHSDATRHTEWRSSLLPSTARAFTYCHRLAFRGPSLETFWYTYVYCDSFPFTTFHQFKMAKSLAQINLKMKENMCKLNYTKQWHNLCPNILNVLIYSS